MISVLHTAGALRDDRGYPPPRSMKRSTPCGPVPPIGPAIASDSGMPRSNLISWTGNPDTADLFRPRNNFDPDRVSLPVGRNLARIRGRGWNPLGG